MNNDNKRPYKKVAILCMTGIVLVSAQIIPMGMGGQIADAKWYIGIAILLFLIAIPAAVLHQTSVNDTPEDPELRRMRYQFSSLMKVNYRRPDLINPSLAHYRKDRDKK